MAKSREIPAQDPVNESETEESEEEGDGSETEVSESEPETEPKKAPAAAAAKKLQKAADSSSSSEESESESESDSDSDSDSGPEPPPTNVKMLPSSSAPTKKVPAKAALSSPTNPTGMKRLATPSLTQGAETKRLKKASATEEGKKSFERVFAPEDEVLLLKELLKSHPSPPVDELYESLKSKVSVPVTKNQVQDKIRRSRNKYFNKRRKIAMKGSSNVEENGKDEAERMVYQLSEKLWGNEEGPKSVVNKNKGPTRIAQRFEEAMGKEEEAMGKDEKAMGKDEKATGKDEKQKDVSYATNGGSAIEWIFGEGTGLLPEEARSELEKRWFKIRKEEARISVEKFELSHHHAKMVHDAMGP